MSEGTSSAVSTSSPSVQPVRSQVVTRPSAWTWVFGIGFLVSSVVGCLLFIFLMANVAGSASSTTGSVVEAYESGPRTAASKVAIIDISGVIGPPLTGSVINRIEHARDDDAVEAVLLRIDSPGGLVADSHQIYHRLKELSDKKPVYASFGRLAASGGYYVAMGIGPSGKIFTEPTTWTGSIGVIIPHYEVDQLANKWGVKAKPLTTGPFKDSLSPFKEMNADEQVLWEEIIDDAFNRFVGVIDDNREALDDAAVREVATGQIFTASQALDRKLVDAEGFEDDALEALIADESLGDVKVVRYRSPPTLVDVFLGTASAEEPTIQLGSDFSNKLNRAITPQPLYVFGWPNVML